jgi:hypothetical protein
MTIRELLSSLLSRSSAGGIWIVKGSYPLSQPLSNDHPFWKMLPYGGTLSELLLNLQN